MSINTIISKLFVGLDIVDTPEPGYYTWADGKGKIFLEPQEGDRQIHIWFVKSPGGDNKVLRSITRLYYITQVLGWELSLTAHTYEQDFGIQYWPKLGFDGVANRNTKNGVEDIFVSEYTPRQLSRVSGNIPMTLIHPETLYQRYLDKVGVSHQVMEAEFYDYVERSL